MPRLVVDLVDPRPYLRAPDWVAGRLRAALPATWELSLAEEPTDGSGDGAGLASASALAAVADAEVYIGFGIPASILEAGQGLRWVHSGTAGAGASLTPIMREREVVFTNSAAVHAVPMAEWVIGAILYFARGFDIALRGQAEGRWVKERFDRADSPVREIADATIGIIGAGGIGREVAQRARAFGARVLGLRRRTGGAGEGIEILSGPDGLARILAESDFLVISAPETAETRGMIDAAALARMKPGAVLLNVARGGLVVEDALVEALRSGHLLGAALDVFAIEPLPEESPLWRAPGVLLTPHVSSYTRRYWEREVALIEDNLARYLAGMPLRNVVDKHAGY